MGIIDIALVKGTGVTGESIDSLKDADAGDVIGLCGRPLALLPWMKS